MQWLGGDGLWSGIVAVSIAVIGFFAWIFRKIFHAAVDKRVAETDKRVGKLETRLDRYYMTADQTAKFFGELMSPIHKSLGRIEEENRELRRTTTEGFRSMNERLDNKQDRRNGTG